MSASACACICAHESLYLYVYPESSIAFTRQTTEILPFIVLQKYKNKCSIMEEQAFDLMQSDV